MVKQLNFSHHYDKLDKPIFTTIRRYDKYKAGEIYGVKVEGKAAGLCQVLDKYKKKYKDIPISLLKYDTGEQRREDILDLFNSFYRNPVEDDEEMTILLLRWVRA